MSAWWRASTVDALLLDSLHLEVALTGLARYQCRMSDSLNYVERVEQAAALIRSKMGEPVSTGIVLGSGLGAFADQVTDATVIPYDEIPHFPTSSVSGHAGRLVLGTLGNTRVAVMQGRVHYYEGYALKEVTFPVRVLRALGATNLVLTNAAGCVNEGYAPGDMMVITDHLNLTGDNPLRGPNDDAFGVRFPDMSKAYSPDLSAILDAVAAEQGTELRHGVYAGLMGPSYETPAEIRMLRVLGADAVGMSTVAEAIAAVHGGLRVVGLSVITNYAAGMSQDTLSHEEVKETGLMVEEKICKLLVAAVERFGSESN